MKRTAFLLISMAFASSALALKQAEPAHFEPAFTDNTGVTWSKPLKGKYSNGCVDAKGNEDLSNCTRVISIRDPNENDLQKMAEVDPNNSRAAEACAAINARLPTRGVYERLVLNFDNRPDPLGRIVPSAKGYKEIQAAFGAGKVWFYSATLGFDRNLNAYANAFIFTLNDDTIAGPTAYEGVRSNKESVLCVN
jgi:hypothetical protein